MQWGSSRPDLFGQAFCSVFEKLQDHTTPHTMKNTILLMEQAYGQDWNHHIMIGDLIGSGCIGQGMFNIIP
jgi:predicted unusual protein kinase regulating ubiquinone biosynthesis (AarF/ABC1/UbiB family)